MGIFNKLFKKAENNSIVMNENWDFYSYEYEEKNHTFEALIEYDKLHATETKHSILSNCLRFILYIDPEKCQENGLPTKDSFIEILDTQKNILKNIKSDSRLVGKMSYGFLVELVFQTNQKDELTSEIKSKIMLNDTIIEFDFEKHNGWNFFDQKIKPDEIWLLKSTELTKIKRLKIENEKNHKTTSTLIHEFSGNNDELDIISNALTQSEGFEICKREKNTLELEKGFKIDEIEELVTLNLKIRAFSESLGLTYLGWKEQK